MNLIHNQLIKSFLPVICAAFVLSGCRTVGNTQYSSYSDKYAIVEKHNRLNKKKTSISRLTEYEFTHPDIPLGFNNKTILFISDLHYPSLFKKEDIYKLSNYIATLDFNILCLGGDYHEDINLINTLFDELGKHVPELGAYAVLGNNDYERGYKQLVEALKRNNIKLLEHNIVEIKNEEDKMYIVGIRNPFDLKKNSISPTLELKSKDLVILLTHTPDYAEDVKITNSDLTLAGHTHGGQVHILGVAPIIPSKYGKRFRSGLTYTTANIPIIITNGIGTSNKNIRIGAPSEVVMIHLKHPKIE